MFQNNDYEFRPIENLGSKYLEYFEKRLNEPYDKENYNKEIIKFLIENKQSLSHILTSHPEIKVNERTIRNWIEKGYMSARIHNLPKKVRFNTKKDYQSRIIKPKNILENRTYSDFKKYKKENPHLMISQMDTIVGLITDKQRVLTIHFPSIHFQFGILLPCNSDRIVIDKLM